MKSRKPEQEQRFWGASDQTTKQGKKINSKQKGNRGEREVAKYMQTVFGWKDARRRVQYSGTAGDDDICCGNDRLFTEVKFTQKWNARDWVTKALNECRMSQTPWFWARRSRMGWLVFWQSTDRIGLMRELRPMLTLPKGLGGVLHIRWSTMMFLGSESKTWPYDQMQDMPDKPIIMWQCGQYYLQACYADDLCWIPFLEGICDG